MTLTDALAAALANALRREWELRYAQWVSLEGDDEIDAQSASVARAILADPAFRDALTAALGEALDAEEEVVGFTVYEAWPSAAAIVARLLPVEEALG